MSAAEGQYLLSKEYSAIALIFWAFLDGRPGRRTDPEDKSLIYTSDARRAGNLFLLFELHRILPKKATAQNEYSEIMRLLEDTEGFANAIVGDSAEDLLSRCRERRKDIRFVNEIVKYMVRDDEALEGRRTIEHAKYFLSKWPNIIDFPGWVASDAKRRGVKTQEKIWSEYVTAAPLLYAIHCDEKFDYAIFDDIESIVDWIKCFCSDPSRIELFLRRAAKVARILRKSDVRRVRKRYFKGIKSIELRVRPFTPEQISFIRAMDIQSRPSDAKDYGSEQKRLQKARWILSKR